MPFLLVIGLLNFDFSEKLWYNIYIRSGEAFFLSPLPTSPHAAVVEQADTRDLKSLGGDLVPVQVRSAAPDLYVFQFLWNGLNRNGRFASFKCVKLAFLIKRSCLLWVLVILLLFNAHYYLRPTKTSSYTLGCRSKVRTAVSKIADVSSILTAPAIGN